MSGSKEIAKIALEKVRKDYHRDNFLLEQIDFVEEKNEWLVTISFKQSTLKIFKQVRINGSTQKILSINPLSFGAD